MLRDNLVRDLGVMLNPEEFAVSATIDGVSVNGIWESKSDIALSGDYSSPAPSLTVRRSDVPEIKNGKEVIVDDRRYRIGWIEWKDSSLVKIYLADDVRSRF